MAKGSGTPEQRASLGERLATARVNAGLHNAAEVARLVGIEPRTFYEYEKPASYTPGPFLLKAMAELYGVTIDWLLSGDDEMPKVYWEWREGPRAKAADPKAFPWIESRSFGHTGSPEFYDALLFAFELGVRDRAEAERGARETERLRREALNT